ncbi:hypothetical protein [Chryseobacterium sp. T1]
MQNLQYPLDFTFKITTLANDFTINDKHGTSLAYVRSKIFKLKDSVQVFKDTTKKEVIYNINANQWIDFNASFKITEPNGDNIGRIARKGMRSIWKSTYNIIDKQDQQLFTITEENAWTKFWDNMVGEIPIVGMFTGYFLNPKYIVKDKDDRIIFRLKKMPSFFGRRFQLDRIIDIPDDQETLCVLSLMMMVLLERARG